MTRINVVNENDYCDLKDPFMTIYFDGKKGSTRDLATSFQSRPSCSS